MQEFAPIHARWHAERIVDVQSTGFLTFHRVAIEALDTTIGGLATTPTPILPYPPEVRALRERGGDLDAFSFSREIEGWHNGVHGVVGQQEPRFGQPRVNIFFQLFWDFHAFIDQEFGALLDAHAVSWDT